MPAALRSIDDIAHFGRENRHALHLIIDGALGNNPELVIVDMEVALVAVRRGRHAMAANHIHETGGGGHERMIARRRRPLHEISPETQIRLIDLVILVRWRSIGGQHVNFAYRGWGRTWIALGGGVKRGAI